MDFSIRLDAVKAEWSIVYMEGSQVIISKNDTAFHPHLAGQGLIQCWFLIRSEENFNI